jgi:colicin import membrane protein
MEPINYLAQVADPFAQATQGLKLGAGMADLQRQQEARAAQQQQAQLAAQEQARFFANPKPTMRDAARFASLLSPEQANAFRPYMEGITKEQQQGTLRRTGQLLSSLQLNPAIAVDRLNQEAEAASNSGDADEAAFFTRLAAAAADPAQGPSVAFKALVQSASGIPGAKDMFETIDKGMGTARAEAQAPAELRQKIAAADKAEAEARVKMETAPDDIAKAKATREFEQAKAKKEQIQADTELETRLQDIGFKKGGFLSENFYFLGRFSVLISRKNQIFFFLNLGTPK